MTIVTRFRKHPRDAAAYWLDAKIAPRRSDHPWIELGLIERKGRRWRWTCWDTRPISGREDTRAEARTALLAHVREGGHLHMTEPEGDQDG
jgi:hypothetical protein